MNNRIYGNGPRGERRDGAPRPGVELESLVCRNESIREQIRLFEVLGMGVLMFPYATVRLSMIWLGIPYSDQLALPAICQLIAFSLWGLLMFGSRMFLCRELGENDERISEIGREMDEALGRAAGGGPAAAPNAQSPGEGGA